MLKRQKTKQAAPRWSKSNRYWIAGLMPSNSFSTQINLPPDRLLAAMWNPVPDGGGSGHQYHQVQQQHQQQQSSSSFSATAASFNYTHDPLPELRALIRAYYTSHQCRCVLVCTSHDMGKCRATFLDS